MTTLMHRNSDRMKSILKAANKVDSDPTLGPEEPDRAGMSMRLPHPSPRIWWRR